MAKETEIVEMDSLLEAGEQLKTAMRDLNKHGSNTFYRNKYEQAYKAANSAFHKTKARLERLNFPASEGSHKEWLDLVEARVLNEKVSRPKRTDAIRDMELGAIALKAQIEASNIRQSSFEIPAEIPMTEARFDMEEAVRDYDNGCFASALVMCRRAYEGALSETYQSVELKKPYENGVPLSVAKLQVWAIDKGLITEKMKQAGFLTGDLGAGGAHPIPISRNKETARMGITVALALLKEIYSNKPKGEVEKTV